MPRSAPADSNEAPKDQIAWKQILIGYGVVLIMLIVVATAQLGLFENPQDAKGPLSLIVCAVVILATVLARPVQAMHRTILSPRPRLDDTLQWISIWVLVLLSATTIIAGMLTFPLSHGP